MLSNQLELGESKALNVDRLMPGRRTVLKGRPVVASYLTKSLLQLCVMQLQVTGTLES